MSLPTGLHDQSQKLEGATTSTESDLRILVMRPDRIGDVLLSTPVFTALKKHYPRCHLTVMVQSEVVPLIQGLPEIDHILVYDPQGKHLGFKGFLELVRQLSRHRFRIAILLQSKFKLALAVYLAKVKYRLGPLSKIHSFLFFNRGTRQYRSLVEMHEADYNLQLLRRLGIRFITRQIPVSVHLGPEDQRKARDWLAQKSWDPSLPLITVHPAMRGSALNWPEGHYIDLIRALIRDERKVLVTVGPDEGDLLERIKSALGTLTEQVYFYGGKEGGTLEKLAGLFSLSTVIVAPSTGPLHLAVALRKPVVTFYSPIRVQSAIRWGPYIQDERDASIMIPEVYCGQDFKCLGNLCNYFPCMNSLTVNQALEEINRLLARATSPN